jgi:hypothetical protein
MGFDPRRWQTPHRARPITANVDALLAENEALRQEVWALRQQLERLRVSAAQRVTANSAAGLTPAQVERWCQALARHPAWTTLRVGPPGGLRGLVEELRRQWWNPSLSLEEELDRQSPGLGAELAAALRGPHSRGRWAVRAAFALYGPRAAEWLNEAPLRVVDELAQQVARLDRRQGREQRQGQERRQGTRTANHTPGGQRAAGATVDPRRREALRLLGLEPGASPRDIKRAYRHLAKAHHPDLGGDAEAFHRLDAAYRLLLE